MLCSIRHWLSTYLTGSALGTASVQRNHMRSRLRLSTGPRKNGSPPGEKCFPTPCQQLSASRPLGMQMVSDRLTSKTTSGRRLRREFSLAMDTHEHLLHGRDAAGRTQLPQLRKDERFRHGAEQSRGRWRRSNSPAASRRSSLAFSAGLPRTACNRSSDSDAL